MIYTPKGGHSMGALRGCPPLERVGRNEVRTGERLLPPCFVHAKLAEGSLVYYLVFNNDERC